MKSLYAEKDRLTELHEVQRADFYSHRDQERELRTVDANIDMILGKKPERGQEIEKGAGFIKYIVAYQPRPFHLKRVLFHIQVEQSLYVSLLLYF